VQANDRVVGEELVAPPGEGEVVPVVARVALPDLVGTWFVPMKAAG